jgi:hypothetical protein
MDLPEIIPWIVVAFGIFIMIARARGKMRREAIRKFARQRVY